MKYIFIFIILISTTTLAQEWELIPNLTPGQGRHDDIHFVDDLVCVVGNNSKNVYLSKDKGGTWSETLLEFSSMRSVKFFNEDIGIIGSLRRPIYRTDDGGDSWKEIAITDTNYSGVCGLTIYNDSTIFGVGTYFYWAQLLKSTDYGLTWETKDLRHLASGLVDIKFYNENIGIATGTSETGAVVIRTTDGGDSWSLVHKTQGEQEYGWKIDFTNDSSFTFISVQAMVDPTTVILKSSDMGATWTEIEHKYTQIQGICFWDEMNGVIGGWGMSIYNTSDGGGTWDEVPATGTNVNRFVRYEEDTYALGEYLMVKKDTQSTIEAPATHSNKNLDISVVSNQNKTVINLTANNQDQIHYYIYDLNGNVLKSRELVYLDKGLNSINLGNELTRGVYFISLLNNEGIYKQKFMVE